MGRGRLRVSARVYWLVAVLALLWNAFGCLDFVLTASRNPDWLKSLPRAYVDWLDSAPTWSLVTWALGVGGGLVGSVCLLVRSRFAVPAFITSLVGLAGNQVWQWTTPIASGVMTTGDAMLSVGVWLIAIALFGFAIGQRRAGVLR